LAAGFAAGVEVVGMSSTMLQREGEIVLFVAATQEAWQSAAQRVHAMAASMIARSRRTAATKADADGVVPDPQPLRVTVALAEFDISARQRGFLHAAVFPQIAEQYTFPDGTRYVAKVWKEFWRARFLGDRWVMKAVPRWDAKLGQMVQPKRKTPHRERVSTEDLSIKGYSEYIDKVIDTATLELGVVFVFREDERKAVRYVKPARVAKKEAVAA
jgi:hypothetical protein